MPPRYLKSGGAKQPLANFEIPSTLRVQVHVYTARHQFPQYSRQTSGQRCETEKRLDLSDVPYIDCSGIATLLEALKIARACKTNLRLTGLHDRPLYLLEVTGLLSLFETCGHISAVSSVQKAQ